MIISRTPYRLSFFGGGTDYPGWYKKNGGQVLSTTIDKHLYITCRYLPPFFEHQLRLVYSKIEACQDSDELSHPSTREVLKFMNIKNGLEIHYDGDLPGRSGLGSSSAFTVGLLNALYAYVDQGVSPKRLMQESINIEQNIIKETVGSQDQANAAYGGFNKISFKENDEIIVEPISLPQSRIEALDNNIMLFYTGIMRTAEKVAASYVNNIHNKENILFSMNDMVDEAINILGNGNLDDFGLLLNETWKLKRTLSSIVSNSTVNEIYSKALSSGALGGKLSGAGGGGFLQLYVPIDNQSSVKRALSNLLHVPFNFEPNGSQIIFNDPNKKNDKQINSSKITRPSFTELKDIK
jgi:D-glycero-alpha-D-manno-heptose-7-phosphate kinase